MSARRDHSRDRGPGVIPESLLAEGLVTVSVYAHSNRGAESHAIETDAVAFTVVDGADPGDGSLFGRSEGMVRPHLEWSLGPAKP